MKKLIRCYDCGKGHMQTITEPIIFREKKYGHFMIPDITQQKCDHCGEVLLDPPNAIKIEQFLKRFAN